jgi:NodT family efflux transporter outer membrane factor (OMF) lipoprotein
VPAQWWELLRSRALDQLVQDGITYNADLAAAEAAVRVAQANALAQRGGLFPTVTGNFDAVRQKTAGQLAPVLASGQNPFSLHTAQVNVSYMLDVWGGTRRQIESADATAEMQAFQREAVYLTLTSNIALAAIEEARLRGLIGATQRIIELQVQLLGVLRRQQTEGQIALVDVTSQETAVARARLLLAPLERDLAKQRNLLAFLTGRFPSEASLATFRLGSFRLPRRLPLSVPADLVRQRPDVRASEANLRSANAEIGAAIANRLPQITLTGNKGTTGEKLAQLFSPGTGFWMIAGNVTQTIFDAGTLMHKQRAAEEATNQAVAEYRSVVLASFQNVADVLRALQADARAVDAAVTAERWAEQNVSLVRRQVEQGQVNIPLLIEAQRALLDTSLARVDAEAARLADTVALFQALGGGWWNRPQIPEPRAAEVR